MTVVFKTDGGKKLGLGHINRCLSIAKKLNEKGIHCSFFITNKKTKKIIEANGHKVFVLKGEDPKDVSKILRKEKCKILIVDSKKNSTSNLLKIIQGNIFSILVDNIKAFKHANLVILPGVKEQFNKQIQNSLIGPELVLIDPNFINKKNLKRNSSLLLSGGSSDKYNITSKFVSAFAKSKHNFKLIVILGKFYDYDDEIRKLVENDERFVILKDPKNIVKLMKTCSLGIITFGITIYEAAASRLPVCVLAHSKENDMAAKRMVIHDWFKYLGKYDEINYDKVVDNIIKISKNKDLLKKMSKAGNLIDGKGSERIANYIIKLGKQNYLL